MKLRPALSLKSSSGWSAAENFHKFSFSRLTIRRRALFSQSRWTRDFQSRETAEVCSRNFWDCKLELNFVPVYRVVAFGRRRTDRKTGLSFLSPRSCAANRWFFEIYIQGSKYNFLELSLNLKRSSGLRIGAESFSYHKDLWSGSRRTGTD